ncbi:hypothetical protein Rhe02_72980 [Rhizocola hellebori]|uniref:Aminoglycoside phosphotransferase domain-containing protein n=1 Tax=Rhizocola hellebori TaxID=1392758 RepID=A0A8J3QH69_9ACTN|nr:phosphotransferase [Rhizocola hellebori]GIH09231.1 hypothetical protein Rhe02_72980 [Rhizocola hellebori]
MLTLGNVPGYLIDCGLVSPQSIVDGDLLVRELSSRNHNFGVRCRQASSHLLKQAQAGQLDTVVNEAEVYRLLADEPSMHAYLVKFHGYDPQGKVLFLQYLHDAVDLATFHGRRRRPPTGVAGEVGAALAALHRLPAARWEGLVMHPRRLSFLTPHRPDLELYRTSTAAQLDLIRIIQGTPGFGESLDELARAWSATTPIHHDARLINFLLTASPHQRRRPRVRLVDWEFAGLGDPRWDIGSVLAGYLSLWLSSIPMSATASKARSVALATRPLGLVQPAILACWRGYVEALDLDVTAARQLLRGTVGFAAVRLVHTAREIAQSSGALTSDIVLHLQVAHNMLARPVEAAAHLLGLALDDGAGPDRADDPR